MEMKINIESTDKTVTLVINGAEVPARIWEGQTESGIPIHCYITRVAVHESLDCSQFERELTEHRKATPEIQAIPLRLIL
jgi:hypothetical protein